MLGRLRSCNRWSRRRPAAWVVVATAAVAVEASVGVAMGAVERAGCLEAAVRVEAVGWAAGVVAARVVGEMAAVKAVAVDVAAVVGWVAVEEAAAEGAPSAGIQKYAGTCGHPCSTDRCAGPDR